MKVAVLTLRLHTNYGGILQAYALMTVLKRMGHEPWLIKNQPFKERKLYSRYSLYLRRAFRKFVLQEKTIEIFREKRLLRESKTLYVNTNRFVETLMQPQTVAVCTEREWRSLQPTYCFDAYIVGSDQVWRPMYAKPISRYFFSFLKKNPVRRFAYAASFGTDKWELTLKQTAECKKLLQLFSGVSVREDTAVALCEDFLGRKPLRLLDPTMLLSATDYQALLPDFSFDGQEAKLFVHLLDSEAWKDEIVDQAEKYYKITSFRVNDMASPYFESKEKAAPSVEDWLAGFVHAEYVVTDSFHACVFAILFHLPFWACGNEQRGLTRFRALLSLFGLENRLLIQGKDDFLQMAKSEQPICWDWVDKKLDEMRKESLDFLISNLKED